MPSLFHMTEAAAIGIHACVMLGEEPGKSLSARQIAEKLAVSYDHCVRVMHRLRQAGIVTSVRGPAGGFRLARPPQETTVLEIYEALEGKLEERRCLFREEHCRAGCLLFGELIDGINSLIKQFFEANNIASLVDKLNGGGNV